MSAATAIKNLNNCGMLPFAPDFRPFFASGHNPRPDAFALYNLPSLAPTKIFKFLIKNALHIFPQLIFVFRSTELQLKGENGAEWKLFQLFRSPFCPRELMA